MLAFTPFVQVATYATRHFATFSYARLAWFMKAGVFTSFSRVPSLWPGVLTPRVLASESEMHLGTFGAFATFATNA